MRKYLQEICAVDQDFVKDPIKQLNLTSNLKVENLLTSYAMK